MKEDGLGWTPSETRQAQLIEWIIPRQDDATYLPVKPFYAALHDQRANAVDVAHDDLQRLSQLDLLDLALGIGGIESFHVRVTADARGLAEQRQAARADRGRVRMASR